MSAVATRAPPATVRPDDSLTPSPPLTTGRRRRHDPTTRSKRAVFPYVSSRFARPCSGRVALTLKAGKKVVARKTVKPDRNCRYRVRFDVLRSRLGSARNVTVTARLGKRTITHHLKTPAYVGVRRVVGLAVDRLLDLVVVGRLVVLVGQVRPQARQQLFVVGRRDRLAADVAFDGSHKRSSPY